MLYTAGEIDLYAYKTKLGHFKIYLNGASTYYLIDPPQKLEQTQLPQGNMERVWRVTRTVTGMRFHCNGVLLLDFTLSGSSWTDYKIGQIMFWGAGYTDGSADTASVAYRGKFR